MKIEGSVIRKQLKAKGLPGGEEKVCCGGRRTFNRDYESQLKMLKMRGTFQVMERGVLAGVFTIA